MAGRDLTRLLRQFRQTTAGDGLSDAQLLERFVATGDEAAFEVLVWRHERLVFGLCRRVLRDVHDAEDAFQAAFLILARRAAGISRREALASWLYRVAYRTALTARARRAKRAAREGPLPADHAAALSGDGDSQAQRAELRAILDEEVNRLPERFRAPIVLCYLEGKTVTEAAGQLGCPRGTVASRLARARERLRIRLGKRGLALPAGGAAAALAEAATSTAAANALVRLAAVAGRGARVSDRVLTLTAEVLRVMSLQKLITGAALGIAAVGILLLGGGLGMQLRGGDVPPPAVAGRDPAPPPGLPGGKPAPAKEAPRLARPKVSRPIRRNLAPLEDFTGRLEAALNLDLRAQVGGRLAQVHTRAGADVKRGDLLFEIEAAAFREKLARAEASLAVAVAKRKLSAKDLERLKKLAASGAVSSEDVDRAAAAAAVDAATFKIAQLDVEQAARELAATRVTAPADGRIGRILVSPGTLVAGVDGTGTVLATLTALDPMYVDFSMDERNLVRYQRLLREGQVKGVGSPLFVGLAAEVGFPHKGTFVSLDDRVNPVTGTIRVRGVIRNPDRLFLPGMFARVRMPFGKPRPVLEVPPDVIGADQGAHYVLVVNDKNVVERRPVRLGEWDGRIRVLGEWDGQMRVITEGLRPDDWVAIEGMQSLRPGATVDPQRVAPAKE